MTTQNPTDADEIKFETESGNEVTVTAEAGSLFVTMDGDDLNVEKENAQLTTERGVDCLFLGVQRDKSGSKFKAFVPVYGRKAEIEQLREDSKSDEPLSYDVVEIEKTARTDGWGSSTVTKQELCANKSVVEMTDDELDLSLKIDSERDVPENADVGDTFTPEDLLGDARTDDERREDAVEEAEETGEEVVISKTTTECNDPSEECNLDHVTTVAMPSGDIETRRTHTY